MESSKTLDCKNECLETSLISINGKLWLEVKGALEKEESDSKLWRSMENVAVARNNKYKLEKQLCSDLKIVLKLPNRLQVQDVLSVSYYHENVSNVFSSGAEIKTQIATPILFSRVVLSLKSKLSLITLSTLVTDLSWDQPNELFCIEKDESICLDLETALLNRLAIKKSEAHENFMNKLNLNCKGCGFLLSELTENWVTAPLPSEMLIHGSEMLTCDNCCPVLSSNSTTYSHRDFGARPNWICLGQYHISIHTSNTLLDHLLFKSESTQDQIIETFFINDINNIYYSSQKALHSVLCQNCGISLGWKNDQDNHISFWKSKVLLNLVSNQKLVSTLFVNYPITSLAIHYIEKYLKQHSKLYITESSQTGDLKNEDAISIYIVKKNVIKLKTQLYTSYSFEHAEPQANLNDKRPVIYNSIKISYNLDSCHVIKSNEHQIHLEKEQFCHIVRNIQENTLFNKNSYFNVPILSSDLV
ncbi:uncharacterized protein ELE39_001504 [Cryptosporidium sp. chipmunk genotype I]|uniref:uncharacterized protein n=1 Tax=Cryptosporidium sp. chipmunk genotype I TaxID=1280935 RepID=UPI00351A0930|nr:hypothetical protein ELE39_001504 [Cryptosporidium sp. chipmunk genotype I]